MATFFSANELKDSKCTGTLVSVPEHQVSFRFWGLIFELLNQDGLTGSAWGDWSSYTDSPLRAFENELGVQAICGMNFTSVVGETWDPKMMEHATVVFQKEACR